jgi:hypothetical protein
VVVDDHDANLVERLLSGQVVCCATQSDPPGREGDPPDFSAV